MTAIVDPSIEMVADDKILDLADQALATQLFARSAIALLTTAVSLAELPMFCLARSFQLAEIIRRHLGTANFQKPFVSRFRHPN